MNLTWPRYEFYYGVLVSLTSSALIFSPFYFIKKHKNKKAIILATIISTLLLIDTVYYSYFKALPTMGIFSNIGQTGDIAPAITDLVKWQYFLLYADIILYLALFKPLRTLSQRVRERIVPSKIDHFYRFSVLIGTVIVFILSLGKVGGIDKIKFVVNISYDTVQTAQYYGVLAAHAFDFTRFVLEETTSLSADETAKILDWVEKNKQTQAISELHGVAQGKNVIMIQVESLGGFVINQTYNDKEITPNLNKLINSSYFFPNDQFVIGGGHSSDSDFVANTSFYPVQDASTFMRYGSADYSGLPKAMTMNGYSAYAYHGYSRNFWNRSVALPSLGYEKFYGVESYPEGAMMNMGLNDGTFLQKTAEYIRDQPKPSLSFAITLTSHVPFWITDETKELGINPDDYPKQVGGYLENINYVDRKLGEFFETLKEYDLYDDSLIVLYGDHTPTLSAFTAGSITYDPESIQEKEVPLFIKLPNQSEGEGVTIPNVGTHLDIMPTILDLVGIQTNQLMFGQSLFTKMNDSMSMKTNELSISSSESSNENNEKPLLDKEAESIATKIIRYNQFKHLPALETYITKKEEKE